MNNLLLNTWPPAYQLKRHPRAKRVKLHASEMYGLQITLPMRFSLKYLPEILEEHKQWILEKLGRRQHLSLALPKQFIFPALNQNWSIDYISYDGPLRLKDNKDGKLLISGDLQDKKAVQKKLLHWLKKQAIIFLKNRIDRISAQIQLPYEILTVRRQKTLWGSCTADKNISLNSKLIFLPLELVDYILIHELCHTKYLNHSKSYWKLVEKFDPHYREHRARMRTADAFIPIELFCNF